MLKLDPFGGRSIPLFRKSKRLVGWGGKEKKEVKGGNLPFLRKREGMSKTHLFLEEKRRKWYLRKGPSGDSPTI